MAKKRKQRPGAQAFAPPAPDFDPAMPLANARHEAFATLIASGTTASIAEAYRSAGFPNTRTADAAGARLLAVVRVKLRVTYLRDFIQRSALGRAAVDRDWVLTLLKKNALAAFDAGDRSACNRAVELLGKEQGMFVDRQHHSWDGDLTKLTEAQLYTMLASMNRMLAASEGTAAEITGGPVIDVEKAA
jgi:hypothetical protein